MYALVYKIVTVVVLDQVWIHTNNTLFSLASLAHGPLVIAIMPEPQVYLATANQWYIWCRAVTVSYGHLARGLEIVSVAISMASSCSIYLYNILNSRLRLLPILHCTCGGQFSKRLRQSVCHFMFLVLVKIPPVHGDAGQNGVSYPKRVSGVRVAKGIGVWKTLWLCNCQMLAIYI